MNIFAKRSEFQRNKSQLKPVEILRALEEMDLRIFNIEILKAFRKNTDGLGISELKSDVAKITNFVAENSSGTLSPAESLLYQISKFPNGVDGFVSFIKLFEGKLLYLEEIERIEYGLDCTKLAIQGSTVVMSITVMSC